MQGKKCVPPGTFLKIEILGKQSTVYQTFYKLCSSLGPYALHVRQIFPRMNLVLG